MAETGRLTLPAAGRPAFNAVTVLRIAIIVAVLVVWEAVAASGLLYRDVVPSLFAISKALFTLLVDPNQVWQIELGFGTYRRTLEIPYPDRWPDFYWHLYTTFYEIAVGMV